MVRQVFGGLEDEGRAEEFVIVDLKLNQVRNGETLYSNKCVWEYRRGGSEEGLGLGGIWNHRDTPPQGTSANKVPRIGMQNRRTRRDPAIPLLNNTILTSARFGVCEREI